MDKDARGQQAPDSVTTPSGRVGDPRGMGDLRKQVAESKHDEAAERRLKSEELAAELRQITSDWQNDLTFQARRSSPTGIYQLRCHRQSSVGSAYGFTDGGPLRTVPHHNSRGVRAADQVCTVYEAVVSPRSGARRYAAAGEA